MSRERMFTERKRGRERMSREIECPEREKDRECLER